MKTALILICVVLLLWTLGSSHELDIQAIEIKSLEAEVKAYEDHLIKLHFKLIECQDISYNCLRNHKP